MDYTVEVLQEIKRKLNELEILIAINKPCKLSKPPQLKEEYKQMTTEEMFELQKQIYNKVKENDNSNGNKSNR